ncbi:MAG: LssY C-terminal domain-containing protein [Gammaproteobacteria bacterium]|nr:LssY C-terminal domain-containing protein [Gammaproteobacteria bacterium]
MITMLIAACESLVVVGIIVPGIAMLYGVGALVGLGLLDLWPIVGWTAAGAALGDGLSYWVGWRYNERLRTIWPMSKYPDLIPHGEAFFIRHGGKSILFGRFAGPMRAIVPAVAGILHMPPSRFYAINITSAIVWAPAAILPGVAIGASIGMAAEIASRMVVLVILSIIVTMVALWFAKRVFTFLHPRADVLLERVVRWSQTHRFLGKLVSAVVDPNKPESRGLIILGSMLIAAVWGFATVIKSLAGTGSLMSIDTAVANFVHDLRTPWTDELMRLFAGISTPSVMAIFTLAVFAWRVWERNARAVAHWLAAAAFGVLIPVVLHVVLGLPSLEFSGERIVAEAFPSMTITWSAVMFMFFAVMVSRDLPEDWRWMPYAASSILLGAISLALLYLELQVVSNVLGGLALGIAWAAVLGIAYRRHAVAPVSAQVLILIAVGVLGLGVGMPKVWMTGMQEVQLPSPEAKLEVPAAAWWSHEWESLPVYRSDWKGLPTQPMTVQWAGDLATLRAQLLSNGWHEPVPFTLKSALLWLAPNPDFSELPLLPRVHDGRHSSLALEKETDDPGRVLVLRLWSSTVQLKDPATPLWVGNVVNLNLIRRFNFFIYPRTGAAFNEALAVLQEDVGGMEMQRLPRTNGTFARTAGWSGEVLLLMEKSLVNNQSESKVFRTSSSRSSL